MLNYTFLLIGIIYTTILPGFVFTEFFLPKYETYKKIPLYLLGSVLVSTLFSYISSLIFGLNRLTLLGCFLFFVILFVFLILKRRKDFNLEIKKNLVPILVGVAVYIVFFIALYPAIFSPFNDYFVMSGPNWQDTAMHISIIESLAQGNFSPQAPYFAGQNLSYYYFSDLHAAIINAFYGNFFPQVLILINPFFTMTFFFSVYALTFFLTKKKIFSILAGVMSVFYGNIGFLNLIQEIIKSSSNYLSLVTNNPFSSNQTILQLVPMADYFLQNRPMMVGLPLFVLIIMLLIDKKFLIAGIFTVFLLKFQLFGFIVACLFFTSLITCNLLQKSLNAKKIVKPILLFLLPSILIGIIFVTGKIGDRTMLNVFFDSFSFGPWQKENYIWYVKFTVQNLNIGILIFILCLYLKKVRSNKYLQPILITSIVIFTLPFTMRFTIYRFDMFKFFYYLIPFICVTLAVFYSNIKYKKTSIIIFGLIVILTSLTSTNVLVHSYLNKNQGYTLAGYESGIWIRENTPQKSIFVTMPTVHCPPTDIAGRLRVISYINWPYSHGFNTGKDNVFFRVKDVEDVYKSGDITQVRVKYKAKYIYYGNEERSSFPDAYILFDKNENLRKIYNSDNILIYEIV